MLSIFGIPPANPQTFRIPAGKHRSRPMIYVDWKKASGVRFSFTVTNDWLFVPPLKNGWSKLFGISAGWNAHKNSARFVFMNKPGHGADPPDLYLGVYVYYKGISPQQDNDLKAAVAILQPGQKYTCEIRRAKDTWLFELDGQFIYHLPCGDEKKRLFIYKPYMGGTYTIGHNWHTLIHYTWIK